MNKKIRTLIFASFFAALTSIGAFISIPIGPVPITLQLLFVLLASMLLDYKTAILSQIVYVFIGLVGFPIFAGGHGGLNSIFSPSFGFLLGYIVCSFVVSKLYGKFKCNSFLYVLTLCIIGVFIVYLCGVPYMYLILTKVNGTSLTFISTLKTGCFIFIPGDIIKILISTLLIIKLKPITKNIFV